MGEGSIPGLFGGDLGLMVWERRGKRRVVLLSRPHWGLRGHMNKLHSFYLSAKDKLPW
jgi:hypothetical protein